jgi:flagellar basal body-associated protein FliL
MIRLLIFFLIRFLIAAVVFYFVLTLLKGMMRVFKGSSRQSSGSAQPDTPPKPKENYKDVQDAKFVELPDKHEESKSESNT